jgi:hypothetical protein
MKPSIDHVAIQEIRDLLREVEKGTEIAEEFVEKTTLLTNQLAHLVDALKKHEILVE